MKAIVLYSIQSTGTNFLWKKLLVPAAKATGKIIAFRGFHSEIKDSPLLEEGIQKEWVEKCMVPLLKSKQKLKKEPEIFLAGFHNGSSEELFCKALAVNKKPLAKVLVPMRDPLMSALTEMRRGFGLWHWKDSSFTKKRQIEPWQDRLDNRDRRRMIIQDRIKRFSALLSLSDKNRFLLPVDLPISYQKRLNKSKEALGFCDLEHPKTLVSFAKEWQPINSTSSRQEGELIKRAILEKDIKIVKDTLDIEFRHLQKNKKLKLQLKKIGYENLCWF